MKKKAGLIAALIIIIAGGIIVTCLNKSSEGTNEKFHENDEETEKSDKRKERTNEEYISVLLDDKDDFEYVAIMMQQLPDGIIYFDDDGISSRNPEIENEILNNEFFYKSLMHLYKLDEISFITNGNDVVVFDFKWYPKDYHGGVIYGENIEDNWPTHLIDGTDHHWGLRMIPNT